MSETPAYTIIPGKGHGYMWPKNSAERKIVQINNLAKNGEEKRVELDWVGQDGPYTLEDLPDVRSLENLSLSLFGKEKNEVLKESVDAWEPYIAEGEDDSARIIISGGTNKISARNVEIGALKKSGNVIGINAAIETRELALANPGDIAFINSEAAQQVAEVRTDLETHIIGKEFLNYNTHRLLYKALESIGEEIPTDRDLQIMVSELAKDPEKVVQVYMTGDEENMLLLYLRNKVNLVREQMGLEPIDKLKVDANSAEITKKLANKGYLYPSPEVASNIRVKEDSYEAWLDAEGENSPIEMEMGIKTPRMPGYHILWEKDYDRFEKRAMMAMELLENRWGSMTNFFKNVEGSDGGGAFKVTEADSKKEIAKKLYNEGHSWVIEPFVNYRKMKVEGKGVNQERSVAPSVHIRGGKGYDTKLVQILVTEKDENGNIKETLEWGGHVYAPKNYIEKNTQNGDKVLGMTRNEYEEGIGTMKELTEKFGPEGLSRGGIDMAVGTISTRWGEKEVNALQDMNIRTNGGDTARGFGKMVERELGEEKPFATLIIKPQLGTGYAEVNEALAEIANELEINNMLRLICSVAPGWGMFGIVGDTPNDAFVDAIRIEEKLKERGLIR